MMQVDITKLLIVVAGIISLTVMAVAEVVSGVTALAAVSAWVGVILGNGKSVLRGQEPGPLLSAKPKDEVDGG